jgi:hypothetical protein
VSYVDDRLENRLFELDDGRDEEDASWLEIRSCHSLVGTAIGSLSGTIVV